MPDSDSPKTIKSSPVVEGVLPVAHTPFSDDGESIDWESLARQVDWALQQGVCGVCTGMVSELLRLTFDERRQLTESLSRQLAGRGAFVASVGAESTRQAVEFAEHASAVGCDAVMAIPPISTRLPADQLIGYFSAIARATDRPVIVQDASGYVGDTIPFEVYRELLERFGAERIWFKPESSPVGAVISQLREATGDEAAVFEGSGGNLLIENFRRGVRGAIPGMEFLHGVVAVWNALRCGDEARAYRIYFPLCALVTLQLQAGLDGFLAIEKYVLNRRGLFATTRRRRPYGWSLDEPTRLEVDRLLEFLEEAIAD